MPRPRSGYQTKDGTSVPGCTSVLSRWKESGALIWWAFERGLEEGKARATVEAYKPRGLYDVQQEAMDVGTFVHALIEAHINKAMEPTYPPEFTDAMKKQAESGYESFRQWEALAKLTVVEQEEPLVSEAYKFGCTPDAIALVTDKPSILDWKSSKDVYLDHILQLTANLHVWEEVRGQKLEGGIHIVRFGKSGTDFTHRHIGRDHPGLELAWDQFIFMLDAYGRDKELKKVFGR